MQAGVIDGRILLSLVVVFYRQHPPSIRGRARTLTLTNTDHLILLLLRGAGCKTGPAPTFEAGEVVKFGAVTLGGDLDGAGAVVLPVPSVADDTEPPQQVWGSAALAG